MKWKGIELEEITELQIFDPPKLMLVWDDNNEGPAKCNVCAIVNRDGFRVITENSAWRHCAEIPEVLATHRELSRWLAEGKGELKIVNTICAHWNYFLDQENEPVADTLTVRKWTDTEWHKPTREHLGLGDK